MDEMRKRSLIKSLTFRLFGIVTLGIISYIVIGSWAETGLITILFNVIRIPQYYWHERWWNKISWGNEKKDK